MNTGSFKTSLAEYREVVSSITGDDIDKGLTPDLRKRLNSALSKVRDEAEAVNSTLTTARYEEQHGSAVRGKEEQKMAAALVALQEESDLLRRCYAIPEMVTGTKVQLSRTDGMPPQKRLLVSLRDGVWKKFARERDLEALVEGRTDPEPLIDVEARGLVRELSAASAALMSLPDMSFKPLKPQLEGALKIAVDKLPPALKLCFFNLTALAAAFEACTSRADEIALRNVAVGTDEGVATVSFSTAKARFHLRTLPDNLELLALRAEFAAGGTRVFNKLLPSPSAAISSGSSQLEGSEYHAFEWLTVIGTAPVWRHPDFNQWNLSPGAPAKMTDFSLREYGSLEEVILLLHQRAAFLTALHQSSIEFASAHPGGSCTPLQSTDCEITFRLQKPHCKPVTVAYPLASPAQPPHCLVGGMGQALCSPTVVRPFYARADHPLDSAPALLTAEAAATDEAIAASVNYGLGLAQPKVNPPLLAAVYNLVQQPLAHAVDVLNTEKITLACWTPCGLLQRKWNPGWNAWSLTYKE
ncbi:hypothetical protein DIPPA_29452 [Diplonema papillatum]|nr:hypothetical protein DIPPA_29452 [Diplonema papillatum]